MLIFEKCPYYRISETLGMGKGLGYCDLGAEAICEGDIQFCEKPDNLRKQLSERKRIGVLENRGEEGQKKKPFQYKVLVADDDEQLRKIVVTFLSREGHRCVTASNGIEALNRIHQDKFDAVISDIVMPEMDGITLTKELISLYPKLPIMIMTGYNNQYPTEWAITAGARGFISKPFSYDEFILRFSKMMSDREMLCQMEAKQNEMVLRLKI
jgi:CheY-like chemotaxis protein